ncbi:MaoC family dehydratase [Nocardia sp. alder85J]|uniref:MaoC family dehydratase n=1 Tax=Nocardia sp. alder85J TaxID=2862949 RepID=UPI001CD51B6A|nr:MaoC family dehydratase [Nocardia sp. alder85J]MCX4095729.1 MaoC family dehydratase [Nocardia sp. alder85J]
MQVFSGKEQVLAAVGQTLGTSEWVLVTQKMVDLFAEATGDKQWIHIDVDRARRESPYQGPIAHGYLTLSLLPVLGNQIYRVENAKMGLNYGSNKVRFPSAVPVGARVRSTAELVDATEVAGGALQLVVRHTVEIEGGVKPAMIAEAVSRVVF